MTAAPILEVRDLRAGYGPLTVLDGVSLSLPAGRCLAVLGPNGAGKTTLLRAITGLRRAQSGAVLYRGRDVTRLPAERLPRLGLSLVPEGRDLFGSMSVEDNLLLGTYSRKDGKAAEAIERVYNLFPRLAERRAQAAATMSGGEQQMLAVGRALVLDPAVLLLDEPSLGLAPLIVQEIMGVISRLRDSGVSVLLVEQNARAALDVADSAFVLEGGRVALEGAAADLRRDERVARIYLGGGATA
ncbi:MAG TPA: ABC transporter ATP-binding protein [Deinococcales bacterium]|nr:ABC transporter ATP-binding protein [Deinococcales bacterium]